MSEQQSATLLELTTQIITAHSSANPIDPDALPELIQAVYRSLTFVGSQHPGKPTTPASIPAVPVKKSIFPDYIVCLEDGRRLKMLKRYLRVQFGMSPADYRAKWGLPYDYPMVAPDYANRRSSMAKSYGMGRKGKNAHAEVLPSGDTDIGVEESAVITEPEVTHLPQRRAWGTKG